MFVIGTFYGSSIIDDSCFVAVTAPSVYSNDEKAEGCVAIMQQKEFFSRLLSASSSSMITQSLPLLYLCQIPQHLKTYRRFLHVLQPRRSPYFLPKRADKKLCFMQNEGREKREKFIKSCRILKQKIFFSALSD